MKRVKLCQSSLHYLPSQNHMQNGQRSREPRWRYTPLHRKTRGNTAVRWQPARTTSTSERRPWPSVCLVWWDTSCWTLNNAFFYSHSELVSGKCCHFTASKGSRVWICRLQSPFQSKHMQVMSCGTCMACDYLYVSAPLIERQPVSGHKPCEFHLFLFLVEEEVLSIQFKFSV